MDGEFSIDENSNSTGDNFVWKSKILGTIDEKIIIIDKRYFKAKHILKRHFFITIILVKNTQNIF